MHQYDIVPGGMSIHYYEITYLVSETTFREIVKGKGSHLFVESSHSEEETSPCRWSPRTNYDNNTKNRNVVMKHHTLFEFK